MKRLFIAAAALIALIAFARAQIWIMSPASQHQSAGPHAPPPACSNSLDFSASCNSQYVGVL